MILSITPRQAEQYVIHNHSSDGSKIEIVQPLPLRFTDIFPLKILGFPGNCLLTATLSLLVSRLRWYISSVLTTQLKCCVITGAPQDAWDKDNRSEAGGDRESKEQQQQQQR